MDDNAEICTQRWLEIGSRKTEDFCLKVLQEKIMRLWETWGVKLADYMSSHIKMPLVVPAHTYS